MGEILLGKRMESSAVPKRLITRRGTSRWAIVSTPSLQVMTPTLSCCGGLHLDRSRNDEREIRSSAGDSPTTALVAGIAMTLVLTVLLMAVQLVRSVAGGGGDDSSASSSITSSTAIETVALVRPPACQFGETLTELRLVEDWQRSIVDTDRRLLPTTSRPT